MTVNRTVGRPRAAEPGAKQSVYFDQRMRDELEVEARRLERTPAWLIQRAWKIAKAEIRALPSVPDAAPTDRPFGRPAAPLATPQPRIPSRSHVDPSRELSSSPPRAEETPAVRPDPPRVEPRIEPPDPMGDPVWEETKRRLREARERPLHLGVRRP